jgi:hypothetical protein
LAFVAIMPHSPSARNSLRTALPCSSVYRPAPSGVQLRGVPVILPPYVRRSKSVETLLPILYLKGI